MTKTYIGRRLGGSAAFVEACQSEFAYFGFEPTHPDGGSQELVLPLSKPLTSGRKTDAFFRNVMRTLLDTTGELKTDELNNRLEKSRALRKVFDLLLNPAEKPETVRIKGSKIFQNVGGDTNSSSLYAVLEGITVMMRQDTWSHEFTDQMRAAQIHCTPVNHVNYHKGTKKPEATYRIGAAPHATARLVGDLLLETIGGDDLELGPIEVLTQQ